MEWCHSVPKIELHAHLNGSIRQSTILDLAKVLGEKGDIVFADVEPLILKKIRSLAECFKMFDLIHTITTDHKAVQRITKEVVEDFAAENVVYLELRTTPKNNEAVGMSKRSYMEAVLNGLKAVDTVDVFSIPTKNNLKHNMEPPSAFTTEGKERTKIHVRLLLSIDRRESTASAIETVQLALEMRDMGVVGIDLSGNPLVGQWQTVLPALEYARQHGLPITLHCGEVPNNQQEVQDMLEFHPHRIGHACCLEKREMLQLKAAEIPVEICLTSNVMTKSVSSINDHHFVDLYKANHPLILCTDDCGVFNTSLTQEYALAASTFGLKEGEILHMIQKAVDYIFADDDVKNALREIFDSASKKFAQDSSHEASSTES